MNDFSECLGSEELAWRKMGLTHGSQLFLVTLDSGDGIMGVALDTMNGNKIPRQTPEEEVRRSDLNW